MVGILQPPPPGAAGSILSICRSNAIAAVTGSAAPARAAQDEQCAGQGGVALPSLQDQLLHTPLSGDLAGTRRRRASLDLSTDVKPHGVHRVCFSAGGVRKSVALAPSPHGWPLGAAAPALGRNLGRPASAGLCGTLVTYYVRHLVWLRAVRLHGLDFFVQVAGEVCAVRRLEVAEGFDGCREMIPLPL